MTPQPVLRSAAGFTLVEILVSLLISGMLTGIVFQLLRAEGHFVHTQAVHQDLQRNARGALEILASELRGVAPEGLRVAGTSSFGIRSPRVWGVVCAPTTESSTTVDVAVPVLAGVDYSVDAAWSRLAVRLTANGIDDWTPYAKVTGIPNAATPGTACDGDALSDGVEMLTLEVADDGESAPLTSHAVPAIADGSVSPSVTVTPQPGDPAYLYDWVTYSTADYSGEQWIVRKLGSGSEAQTERIAGPITSAASTEGLGLQFMYYDAAGAALPFETGGSLSASNRGLVRQVDIVVKVRSRRPVGSDHEVKTDTVTVYLRNQ